MKTEDFQTFTSLLKRTSGLVLGEDKSYLLESRLLPVARKWNLRSIEDLAREVRARGDRQLENDIMEAMTTNESSFFRDTKPFDTLKETVLPKLMAARGSNRSLRIWSAAASSGQEPFSIAMVLKEVMEKNPGWRFEVVATDISQEMIDRCKTGIYSQFEVQRGLPITHLVKYFTQVGEKWQISEELRRMVSFRTFNLLQDPSALGRFDIVFCRNVLIYFDQQTKGQVLGRIAKIMADDGGLFLGGAETVIGISDAFTSVEGQRGLYYPSRAGSSIFGGSAAAAGKPAASATPTLAV